MVEVIVPFPPGLVQMELPVNASVAGMGLIVRETPVRVGLKQPPLLVSA